MHYVNFFGIMEIYLAPRWYKYGAVNMVEKFELSCFGEEENVLYMGVMVENWWKKMKLGVPDKII